jgi:hypothetical protein
MVRLSGMCWDEEMDLEGMSMSTIMITIMIRKRKLGEQGEGHD